MRIREISKEEIEVDVEEQSLYESYAEDPEAPQKIRFIRRILTRG